MRSVEMMFGVIHLGIKGMSIFAKIWSVRVSFWGMDTII